MLFYTLQQNYQLQISERSLLPFKISAYYISPKGAYAMMICATPRFKLLETEKNRGGQVSSNRFTIMLTVKILQRCEMKTHHDTAYTEIKILDFFLTMCDTELCVIQNWSPANIEVTPMRKWLSFHETPAVPMMRIFAYKIIIETKVNFFAQL